MRVVVREVMRIDVAAIDRLHAAAWLDTYRGILSEHVLAIEAERVRAGSILDFLDDASADHVAMVATINGEVVGVATGGPARDEALGVAGEIYAVYVARRYQYRGIGSRLAAAVAGRLARRGLSGIGLWLARDNLAAIAFARALGAELAGSRAEVRPDFPLTEIAVVWPDASALMLWNEAGDVAGRRGEMRGGAGQSLDLMCGCAVHGLV